MAEEVQPNPGSEAPSKGKNIATWIVTALAGIGFVLAGSFKLMQPEEAGKNFEHFGLPAGLAIFIGLCEMAGGIGLFIPKLASLAASGLVIIMLGAVYNHLSTDPFQQAIGAIVMLCLCATVLWIRGVPFKSQ